MFKIFNSKNFLALKVDKPKQFYCTCLICKGTMPVSHTKICKECYDEAMKEMTAKENLNCQGW